MSNRTARSSAAGVDLEAGPRRLPAVRLIFFAAAVVAGLALGPRLAPALGVLVEQVHAAGAWAPALFVLGYAVATVGLVPGSVLTLAAGSLFGLTTGVLCVFAGAVLGSSAAFLVARHLARPAVERRIGADARFAAIDRAIRAEGRKIVFLLRLSPVFPFNVLNYALGLTPVRFLDYLAASPGMLPGTLLYVYLGKVGADAAAARGGAGTVEVGTWIVRLAGLAATVAVTTLVTRLARRALREATGG